MRGSPTHVLQLVARDLVEDPRALRAAHTARDADLRVTALCMLPRGRHPTPVPGVDVRAVPGGGWSGALRGRSAATPSTRSGAIRELRAVWRLARQLRWAAGVALAGARPDIVHAHDLETLPAGLALAPAALVYDAHELYADWDEHPTRVYQRYCQRLEQLAFRRAFRVVTVSESIAEVLAHRYGGPLPLVVLNVPDAASAPERFNPISGRPRVIYQGVLAENRGLEVLAEAGALVPEVEIFVRGFGPLETRLCAAGHVTVLDPIEPDRMVEGLAGFDIGVVPYLPTSLNNALCLPNKLFEYMAAGLGVVASDLRELRRVVGECDAGELFTPNDAGSLAAALRRLTHAARLPAARENALRAMQGPYSWERQAARLLELYRAAGAVS
ncbi:MAG TPA: glycosyltransferase [Gaiellaceae bacterium]|nr:glycosyltransferase [Gaiellaceae bacterium]